MNSREKTLLTIFIGLFTVIIGGGLLAFSLKSYRSLSADNETFRRRVAGLKQTIAEGSRWKQRSEWLQKHAPAYASREEASSKLLDVVQAEADKTGITLGSRELVGEQKTPDGESASHMFEQTSVKLTLASVAEKQLFTWLHALQRPGAFLGVTRITVEPSNEGKTVNCDIHITHFYHEKPVPQITRAN